MRTGSFRVLRGSTWGCVESRRHRTERKVPASCAKWRATHRVVHRHAAHFGQICTGAAQRHVAGDSAHVVEPAAMRPSARLVRAVAAERADLERQRAHLAREAADLRAALARIEQGMAEIDEQRDALDRLVPATVRVQEEVTTTTS